MLELEKERQTKSILEMHREIGAQQEKLEKAREVMLGLAGSDGYLEASAERDLCEELLSDLDRRLDAVLEDADGWKMIWELASP